MRIIINYNIMVLNKTMFIIIYNMSKIRRENNIIHLQQL